MPSRALALLRSSIHPFILYRSVGTLRSLEALGGTPGGCAGEALGVGDGAADELPCEVHVDVSWQRLREEVRHVLLLGDPSDAELALADAVAQPVEPHVDGLGLGDLDRVVGQAHCGRVVADVPSVGF